MANNPLPKPYFPVPPTQYDPAYFREVTKIFSVFLQQASNPGKVTADGLNLKPFGARGVQIFSNNTSAISGGLLPGDVYMLSTGELKIVISPSVIVSNTGTQGIAASGNVTISTP